MTRASSVERGRWKFVRSASTRRNSKPGVMKSSVRPLSGAPRASVSSTARRRRADGEHAIGGLDPLATPPACDLRSARRASRAPRAESSFTGRNVSSPTWSVMRSVSRAASSSCGEVEARSRSGGRARLARVDGLVAVGVVERRRDVRRQRRARPPARRSGGAASAPRRGARAARRRRSGGPARACRVGRASASHRSPSSCSTQEHFAAGRLERDPRRRRRGCR